MTFRIVVTGKTGQVGRALCARLQPHYHVTALGREDLDLDRWEHTLRILDDTATDLIINAAAYTDVERAEQEEQAAHRINADLPRRLAGYAAQRGAGFIHFSTDYVFDGEKDAPYLETDTPNPVNAYGRSKRAGEIAVAESGDTWIVARLSWIYDARGRNFLNTMLSLLAERPQLKVVDDQRGAPTSAAVVADAIARLIGQVPANAMTSFMKEHCGYLNIACTGETTWRHFAEAIAEQAKAGRLPVVTERIEPILSADYWGKAQRPLNSRLDLTRLERRFGIRPVDWTAALEEVMKRAAAHD